MQILAYIKPGGVAARALDGLSGAGHRALLRNIKYFRGPQDYERCDAVLVDPNAAEVVRCHMARGVPQVAIGRSNPFGYIGYPVGSVPEQALANPDTWAFLESAVPNCFPNPSDEMTTIWFCPGGGMFNPGRAVRINPARPARPRRLADLLPADALREAPRVFIVGGGPSLEGFDPEALRGEVVIGVNRAFERFPCGMVVTMDSRFLRWVMNGELGQDARTAWDQYRGIKVFCRRPNEAAHFEGLYEVSCQDVKQDPAPAPQHASMEHLGVLTNSGYAALMLAISLGARDISLLGFDMGGRDGRQAWWHQPHPAVESDDIFLRYIPQFEAAAALCRERGIKVATYGDTALTCFPNRPFSVLHGRLRSKAKWPQVVGYYTNPEYESEAREMERTARFFGLEVDLVAEADRGGWDANTRRKAFVVEEALRRHNRPILYLDADSRVRRYPALFYRYGTVKKQPPPDMGLCWIDWPKVPGSARQDRELMNAVMWLSPTERTYAALRYWQDLVLARADTKEFEQRQLEDALKMVDGLVVREIPMPYNQIHDLMRGVSDRPVIEQMQASRRLRRGAAA